MKSERYVHALLIKGASVAALFLSQVLLARAATERSEFGKFGYLVSVLNIASFVCIWGVDKFLVREVAVHREAGQAGPAWREIYRANRAVWANALLGMLPLVGYLVWRRPGAFPTTFLVAACIALLGIAAARTSAGASRGLHRVIFAEASLNLIRPLVLIAVLGAAWAWQGKLSAPWLVAAMATSFFVVDFLMRRSNRRAFPPNAESQQRLPLRPLYQVCTPFLLIGVGLPLLSNLDVILLGNLSNDIEVSGYAASARVINLAIVGLVSVNLLVAPRLPVLYQQGKRAEMQALLRKNNQVVLVVSLLPAAALYWFGGWILSAFGTEYSGSSGVLKVLLIGQLINAAVGPVNLICMMAHRQRVASVVILLACVLEVVLCYFLIPEHGAMGAAWANAAALGFLNLTLAVVVFVELKVDSTILNLIWRRRT